MSIWGGNNLATHQYQRCGAPLLQASSANTKGSWVEIKASTSVDCHELTIYRTYKRNAFDFLVDIGIGASGSQTTIISNYLFPNDQSDSCGNCTASFPIYIPAGTQIWGRQQNAGGNFNIYVGAFLKSRNPQNTVQGSLVTTYGANTSDSGGTQMDTGSVAWTWQSWQVLSSSITHPIHAIHVALGRVNSYSRNYHDFRYDIGYGAASSEKLVFRGRSIDWDDTGSCNDTYEYWHPVNIPAGSRLVARCRGSATGASDRIQDLVVYGVT